MSRLLIISLLALVCTGFSGVEHSVVIPSNVARSGAGSAVDDPSDIVLARVEEAPITAAAFKEHYVEYLLRTGIQDASRLRRAVLTQLVNDHLLIQDAQARGIERTPAYGDHLETARKKLTIELYVERTVLDTIAVREQDLEEAFVRMNTVLTARHLYARTRGEADQLYERLRNGESFETLAREIFADSALAHGGGSIGEFSFDEMDPDFEDAAFGLAVGGISAPVRTAQGYSIIQVTDRFTQPILTEAEYAERKSRLESLVLRKKRTQARSHFIRRLAGDLNVQFHEPALGTLLGQITGTDLIESFEGFLEQPLVSFKGGRWTVDEFRRRAASSDPRRRAAVRSEADLKDFITGLIVRRELLARAQGLAADPDLVEAIDREMRAWILKTKKEELAGRVRISDEEVRRHYETHQTEFTDAEGAPQSFEEVAERIHEQLLFEQTQHHVLEYVASLRSRHTIEIDEHALFALPIAGRSWEDLADRRAQRGSE